MKKYSVYKDSGIEWIGEIPEHWEIKSLKYLLLLGKEGIKIGPFGSMLKSDMLSENGRYKVYGQENVIKNNFKIGNKFINDEKFAELSQYEIKLGDIVITMMGTTGNCQVVPESIQQGIMDSHLIRIKVNENIVVPKLLALLVRESYSIKHNIKIESRGSIMEGLNSSIIKSLKIPIAPLEEQQAIATYLDRKIAQIDTLISNKEKLIELLKEERTAIINQAVTKGLNPDVPMKDSGIEWLGEIPEHWEAGRLKQFTSKITDGSHHSPATTEIGKRYISVKDVDNYRIDFENCKLISEDDFEILVRNGCRPERGDILLTKDGTIGRAFVVGEYNDFVVLSSLGIIRPIPAILNSVYLRYYLTSSLNIDQMLSLIQGSALTRITITIIKNLYIVLPPLEEQLSIINHLDRVTQDLDFIILKEEKLIDKLKEYKTALISEVVTGKIDVREEVLELA